MAEVPNGNRRLVGSDRRPARGARRVRSADPSETISFVLCLRRRPGGPVAPDHTYWTAHPPGKRRFLSREELVLQARASQADVDKVTEFARKHGFEVGRLNATRRTIRLSGTVEQANRAFAVDLGWYESPEESYRGREGVIHLPEELVGIVVGVFGLDNRRMARRAGGGPPGAEPLTPLQVAAHYNFPSLDASGQTIGIIEFGGGFAQSDLDDYFSKGLKLTAKPPVVTILDQNGNPIAAPGYVGTASTIESTGGPDIEVAQDIQIVASVAQGANIVVYFAPFTDDGWLDAVNTAIYESPVPLTVLSISWGLSEDQWDSGMNVISGVFQDAAQLGTTIFVTSGDQGASDGQGDGAPHVDYPGTDPWVTCCGGTYIANFGKPTLKEGTWNDSTGATGGGMSIPGSLEAGANGFGVPSWQGGLQVSTDQVLSEPPVLQTLTGRGLPDIAGNASLYSGYNIYVYGQPILSLQPPYAGGGTSVVAPLYAALIAILSKQLGWPPGYLNPFLYELGAAKSPALVSIDDGGNNYQASAACAYYVSTPGWNACTGWGRLDGNELLTALITKGETVMPINPDNPFSFPSNFPPNWMIPQGGEAGGGDDTFDSLQVGAFNTADNYYAGMGSDASKSDYNGSGSNGITGNGGDGSGNDPYGDVTVVNTAVGYNPTLAGDNIFLGVGSIGLVGRSRGTGFSIGVMGQSSKGCAVYGLATDENPTIPAVQPAHGIGVIGRSMGGIAPEAECVENLVGEPVGVLGQATTGVGVRGHGGPLTVIPLGTKPVTPPPPVVAAPGGVFSTGQMQQQVLPGSKVQQTVSLTSLPQMRLVPSVGKTLPAVASIGDFFLVIQEENDATTAAQLFICTAFAGGSGIPQWQQVQLGTRVAGGSSV